MTPYRKQEEMGVLTRPRQPLIDAAINLSRHLCTGHAIDGVPALAHALAVARKIEQHLPTPGTDVIAAALLHESPYQAPPELELHHMLDQLISPNVTRIVRAIAHEHYAAALGATAPAGIDISDPDALVVSAADKVVSIGVVLQRARRASDAGTYWVTRRPLIKQVGYFRAFVAATESHLPVGLAHELATMVEHVYEATMPYRWPLHLRQEGAETS